MYVPRIVFLLLAKQSNHHSPARLLRGQRGQVARAVLQRLALDIRSVQFTEPESGGDEEELLDETVELLDPDDAIMVQSIGVVGTMNRLMLHVSKPLPARALRNALLNESDELFQSDQMSVAWFLPDFDGGELEALVAARVDSQPREGVFAMLDEPSGTRATHGYATGGWVAAPVVGRVIARIGPMLGVRPVDELAQFAQRRSVGEHRHRRGCGEVGRDADHLGGVDARIRDGGRHGDLEHVAIVVRNLQRPLGRKCRAGGDESGGVSAAVAEAVRVVRASGLPNETNAMFTNIEGEWNEVFAAVSLCHEELHRMGAPRQAGPSRRADLGPAEGLGLVWP